MLRSILLSIGLQTRPSPIIKCASLLPHHNPSGGVSTRIGLRFKSGTSARRWVARQLADSHTKQARQERFRSRAAYKLIELDEKFRLFDKNVKNVVDLGFAPGAWTQVAMARMSALGIQNPKILGVDLIQCASPSGCHFLQGDILSRKTHGEISEFFGRQPVDLVLSDMMANTSGLKENDHFSSMDLCEGVLMLSQNLLSKGGSLAVKFYSGAEDRLFEEKLRTEFQRVYRMKPKACRAELRELYFVALRKKTEPLLQ